MKDEIYLSIADFAEAAGVSKQAVYKRLKKDLGALSKVEGGKTLIAASAINLFTQAKASAAAETKENAFASSFLLAQLAEKDNTIKQQQATIEALTEQLNGLQAHIIAQSASITDILQKQSKLQENFQILLGQQQKQLQESSLTTEQPVEQPIEQPVETPKKGFFSKLFG